MYNIYQINNNETLSDVAKKIGIDEEELKKINGITTDVILKQGSFIIIPKVDTNFKTYTVKNGDTISKIARENNINYKTLLEINGLDDGDIIYPGDIITIPRINTYVTKKGDTIKTISQTTKIPIEELINNNETLILLPDQLVKY